MSPIEHAGLRLRPYPIQQQEGQFELTLQLVERTAASRAHLCTGQTSLNTSTIRGFADQYLALLEAVTSDPAMALGSLPTLSASAPKADDDINRLLDQLGAARHPPVAGR